MSFKTNVYQWLGVATVVTVAAINGSLSSGFLGLVALVGLLVMPGLLLMLMIGSKGLSKLEQTLFSLAGSIAFVMAVGLLTNFLGLQLGLRQPLTREILMPVMSLSLSALLAASWYANRHKTYTMTYPQISGRGAAVAGGFALLPLLAALGADSINNGGPNLFTLAAYVLVALSAVVLVWYHRSVRPWMWPWAIFTMALAVLLSTSLRGMYITGHDIQLEYFVYHLTSSAGVWSMASFRDAYNACLSITILPTTIGSLTGIDGLAQYKVVNQVLFAAFTAGVFGISRRYLNSASAFLTAFVFITFPTFITDMTMLNRQEIAFGFFVVLLLALFNKSLSAWTRRWYMIIFVTAMVMSHYSTTFVAIGVFAGAYTFMTPFIIFRKQRKLAPRRMITVGVVAASVIATVLWTGVYTKTSSNISSTIVSTIADIPNLLKPKTATDDSSYSVVQYPRPNPQTLVAQYALTQHDAAAKTASQHNGLFDQASKYMLASVTQPVSQLTPFGNWVSRHVLAPAKLNDLGKAGYALIIQGLIVFGIVITWWRRRALGINSEFLALAPAGVGLLALQVLVPTISYGLFRMLQQDLIFLGVPIIIGAMELLRWLRLGSERVRLALLASGLAVAALLLTGTFAQLTGGTAASLPYSNSGFYYDAYYTTSDELATYAWLGNHYQPGSNLNTDSFSRMKLLANTGITSLDGLTPGEITKDSFVMLDGTAVTDNRVALYFRGQLIFYRYPTTFLNANKNLVYSTSTTRIYR